MTDRRYPLTVDGLCRHIDGRRLGKILGFKKTEDGLPGAVVLWEGADKTETLALGYLQKVSADTAL